MDRTDPMQLNPDLNATAIALSSYDVSTFTANHVVNAGMEEMVPGKERKRERYWMTGIEDTK